jgi:multiple sugar transport system ATP-binding protein
MASVTLSNLKKSYAATEVIQNLNLEILDGEFVVLVGPSGCGKSTLLRMIAGLENITAGDIHIGERKVNNVPAKNRDIAMVFQNYALYPHKTVRQNIEFSLRLRKTPKAEMDRRVNDAAKLLELTPLLDRKPRALSGGQRQRVAMGRAIVRNPEVFLFDEPLSNLDAKLRVEMRTEIKALHNRLRTTSIYVTHDQIEAMTMGDRVVVMHDGMIQQVGHPLDVYDTPQSIFVAGFIGSPAMNIFPAETDRNGITFAGTLFAWPGNEHPENLPHEIVCGLRPESLDLVEEGQGAACIIESLEPMGSETVVVVSASGSRFTSLIRDRRPLEVGKTINLAPQFSGMHLFDKQSGLRLDWQPNS